MLVLYSINMFFDIVVTVLIDLVFSYWNATKMKGNFH